MVIAATLLHRGPTVQHLTGTEQQPWCARSIPSVVSVPDHRSARHPRQYCGLTETEPITGTIITEAMDAHASLNDAPARGRPWQHSLSLQLTRPTAKVVAICSLTAL